MALKGATMSPRWVSSWACVVTIAAQLLSVGTQRSHAQGLMATVTTSARIYVEPRVLPTPLRTAPVGTRLEVQEEGPTWTRVRFTDPQVGIRVGFVETKHLRIERSTFGAPRQHERSTGRTSVTRPPSAPFTLGVPLGDTTVTDEVSDCDDGLKLLGEAVNDARSAA
jgi:hypothetical protein